MTVAMNTEISRPSGVVFYIRSMVVTTEADSSDTAAHPHDGKPSRIYVLCVTNGLHGEEV